VARKRKRKEREAEAGFSEAPAAPGDDERQRLTPVDIQGKVFRLAFRGYSERDVDEFLDRITEDLAALHEENKRLGEQLAEGGGNPAGAEEAQRQAEAIVRQAREHAARLVEDAEARAAGDDVVASAGLPTSFLLKERQFLQQMAGLIQDHARRLKEDVRRARSASPEVSEPELSQEEPAEPLVAPPPPPPPPADPSEPGVSRAAAPSPTPEEATAPWTQVDPDVEPPEGQAGGEDQDRDPLLSAWESAFTAEGGAELPGEKAVLYPSETRNRKDEEGEPSLRELFWGDEG
jgi:DivIVA domain-containing protein